MAALKTLASLLPKVAVYTGMILGTAIGQNVLLQNDLKGTIAIHDPSTILKENGTYYVWGSHGSSLMSKDRKTWTNGAASPATSQPWWAAHGGELWAPEVHYMNGFYYCYYSVSAWMDFNSAIGVTRSPTLDPSASNYKWTDLGMVIDSAEAQDGGKTRVNVIDPGAVADSDGKHYLIFGSFQGGVRMAELNPATGLLKNKPSHPTVITSSAGEGSGAIQVGSYYYYAISEGKCCKDMSSTYHMDYARATKITGPYTTKSGASFVNKNSELLLSGSNNSTATTGAVAVGVGGFFWDGNSLLDTLFMDYMAYTAPSGGALLNIQPLYQDATGWLTFDKSKGTIITRPASTTTVYSRTESSHPVNRIGLLARVNGMERQDPSQALYSLTGQKVSGAIKSLPAGIYLAKPLP